MRIYFACIYYIFYHLYHIKYYRNLFQFYLSTHCPMYSPTSSIISQLCSSAEEEGKEKLEYDCKKTGLSSKILNKKKLCREDNITPSK